MGVRRSACSEWFRKPNNLLLVLTMASVAIGMVAGGTLRYTNPSAPTIRYIGFPGELFMNMLKCMILPLIVSSLVSGLSQLDGKTSGKVGSRAVMYYVLTTTLAVILGIILVMLIHPGNPNHKHRLAENSVKIDKEVSPVDKFLDLFRNMFPSNIIQAMFEQQHTVYKEVVNSTVKEPTVEYTEGMNVLGLIVFCIVLGLVISKVGKPAKPLKDLFHAIDVVITKMVTIIMWIGPIGIASLIAAKMLEIADLAETGQMLGMYMVTVTVGLLIQSVITLPLIYFISSRKNPYVFLKGLGQAITTALGTSSSGATLPVTFRCLNEIGIDRRITKFVLPVGSVINMDGTALYEAVASVFIAQMNGLDMGVGQVITVSITATLASIGAASIPSAGLVTMMIVLTALGLPPGDVSLIIAVDWLLDRLRTAVNVIGDAFGCGFVHALCINDLETLPKEEDADIDEMLREHGVDVEAFHKEGESELEKKSMHSNNNEEMSNGKVV